MSIVEYGDCDATALAELVRRREVSPGELLDEALRRLDAKNPTLNAIVNVFEGRARAAIAAGLPDGPFSGVPFVLKDLGVDLAGEITSNGSRFFADNRAPETSEIAARYERAGLVIFGKTNTPELGLNVSTEPLLFGPTRNPWNHRHSAGGSSGGAAAAVAGGIVAVAHATDGGGSIRIPASSCGLFGLKPNRGRTPIGPPLGEGWNGLSHGHVVSKSVRDSAALLDATAGPSVGEPYAAPASQGSYLAATRRDPGRLRVRLLTTGRPGVEVDLEAVAAVTSAARLMESLGHDVEEASLDFVDWAGLMPAFGVLSGSNVAAAVRAYARAVDREPSADNLENVTLTQLALASTRNVLDYVDAVQSMHRIGRQVGAWFTGCDIVMTPTCGVAPPALGIMNADTTDLAGWGAASSRVANFLGLFNFTGQPAMSVPLHVTAAGLPIGVQFVGGLGHEELLFSLAAQLERAAPWQHPHTS